MHRSPRRKPMTAPACKGSVPPGVEKQLYNLWHYQTNGLMEGRRNSGGDFPTRMFHLMMKADPLNFEKLAAAFPDHGAAFRMWREAEDEESLWAGFGFGNRGVKKN